MLSLLPFLVLIPIGLIIAGGILIGKRGNADTAGQRTFLFFTWTSIIFWAMLLVYWIFPHSTYSFILIIVPLVPALIVMILLHSQEWRNLYDGQKRLILAVVILLTLLTGAQFLFGNTTEAGSQLRGLLPGLMFLSISAFVYIAWKWGGRFPFLFGVTAILYLALFNWLELGSLSLPDELSQGLLARTMVLAWAYLIIPGYVITTIAILILSATTLLPRLDKSGEILWNPIIGRLILSVVLLGYLVYTYVWLSIWDAVDDGVRFILLLMATITTVVSIGMVIGMTSSGWRRWMGLPFAALVLALVVGGVLGIGKRYSNYSVTEERAMRLQEAIESFHTKTGWYPLALHELTAGELWRIPLPMIIPGQNWCYQGGSNYYRLGVVYREHWSSPYFSVRVYASAGDIPDGEWACDEKLAEVSSEYQAKFNSSPTPIVLPDSSVSVQRTVVEPILSGTSFSVGTWSPDGRYLVFGQAEYFMDEVEQVTIDLHFIDSTTGDICQPAESRWTVQQSDGLREHYAWLPDGRFLYVTDAGEMWTFRPCAGEIEDLSNRYATEFTSAVSFHEQSGKVLLTAQSGLWLLNGVSLELRTIADVPTKTYRAWYAWSADGRRLAISTLMGPAEVDDAFLYIVNAETGVVEWDLPLQNVSDVNLPIVEWLTRDELLVHGKTLTVMDFRTIPPATTDLIHDVFLLDVEYPTDVSSMDSHPATNEDGYTIGVRVNHPHNQGAYVYDSTTRQVTVYEHDTHSLFFFPDGGWIRLFEWEDVPSYTDEYEMVWMDRPDEARRLVVEGHVPRSHPQMFPGYLPDSSRLVFSSSQGISLVSMPDGEIIRFWELSGGADFFSVIPSPNNEALVIAADGDGLYYIPLPPK